MHLKLGLSKLTFLQSWQNVFEETLSHYHRLSAQQDLDSAIQMWKDYLCQVDTFLNEPMPSERQALADSHKLCAVHSRIMKNHHQLIKTKVDEVLEEDKDTVTDIQDLSKSHEEVLKKIAERITNIEERMKAWEIHRRKQDSISHWLRETEKEKLKLNLKHLNVKQLPEVLKKIDVSLKN